MKVVMVGMLLGTVCEYAFYTEREENVLECSAASRTNCTCIQPHAAEELSFFSARKHLAR